MQNFESLLLNSITFFSISGLSFLMMTLEIAYLQLGNFDLMVSLSFYNFHLFLHEL